MNSTAWTGALAGGFGLYLVGLTLLGEALFVASGRRLNGETSARTRTWHGFLFGLIQPGSRASLDSLLALMACGGPRQRSVRALLVGAGLATGVPLLWLACGPEALVQAGLFVIAIGALSHLLCKEMEDRSVSLGLAGFGCLLLGSAALLSGMEAAPGIGRMDLIAGTALPLRAVFGLVVGGLAAAALGAPSLLVVTLGAASHAGHVDASFTLAACLGAYAGTARRTVPLLRGGDELAVSAASHLAYVVLAGVVGTVAVSMGLLSFFLAEVDLLWLALWMSAVSAGGAGLALLLPIDDVVSRLPVQEEREDAARVYASTPSLALSVAEREVVQLARRVERLARGLLRGEGNTRFRIEETRRAARQSEERVAQLEAQCLGRPATAFVRSGLGRASRRSQAWARILERTLRLAEMPNAGARLDRALAARLQQVELGVFHLLESCALHAASSDSDEDCEGLVATVGNHLSEVERRLLSLQGPAPTPTERQGLVWRIEQLRRLAYEARAAA